MQRDQLLAQFSAQLPVLDKGHVRLVDVMGDDTAIVQAARVSYGKGTSEHKFSKAEDVGYENSKCEVCGTYASQCDRTGAYACPEGDRKLIRYLVENRHTSPLEMCEIKLHCKMPIFVARQWIRHRTASVNEVSGRYTILPDEFYTPTEDRVGGKGVENKQGTEGQLAGITAETFLRYLDMSYRGFRASYMDSDRNGVSNELARLFTGVGQYTEWYWKIDLHNLLHFLGLRMDEHAQWETRMYANAIAKIVKAWVPFAWEAFEDFRLNAITLSAQERNALAAMIDDHVRALPRSQIKGAMDGAGMDPNKRTRAAFLKKLGLELP